MIEIIKDNKLKLIYQSYPDCVYFTNSGPTIQGMSDINIIPIENEYKNIANINLEGVYYHNKNQVLITLTRSLSIGAVPYMATCHAIPTNQYIIDSIKRLIKNLPNGFIEIFVHNYYNDFHIKKKDKQKITNRLYELEAEQQAIVLADKILKSGYGINYNQITYMIVMESIINLIHNHNGTTNNKVVGVIDRLVFNWSIGMKTISSLYKKIDRHFNSYMSSKYGIPLENMKNISPIQNHLKKR